MTTLQCECLYNKFFVHLLGLGIVLLVSIPVMYCLIQWARVKLPHEAPPDHPAEAHWTTRIDSSNPIGVVVGLLELTIFYAGLALTSGWPLVTAWLAVKVAIAWQGTSFGKLPEKYPTDTRDAAWSVYMYQLGRYRSQLLLLGTAANMVLAIAAIFAVKWILNFCGFG